MRVTPFVGLTLLTLMLMLMLMLHGALGGLLVLLPYRLIFGGGYRRSPSTSSMGPWRS